MSKRYIWHTDYAYTYPTLDVNRRGDVAMTYCSDCGQRYVQHGVGFVSDPIGLSRTISHRNSYGGGHFMGIPPAFPDESCFVAAGHIGVLRQTPNRPDPVRTVNTYFVRFSRNDVRCGLEGNV